MNAFAKTKTDDPACHRELGLFEIAGQMKASNLSDEFVVAAIRTALDYEGVADLVIMWSKETDIAERDEIIADIQEMIEACSNDKKEELPSIRFNDLEAIAKNIRAFKDALLVIVNDRGGISNLAELTGIPQPSLSRFFNSSSIPHRATLLKIRKALGINDLQIPINGDEFFPKRITRRDDKPLQYYGHQNQG